MNDSRRKDYGELAGFHLQAWREELVQGILRALIVVGGLAVVAGSYYAYVSMGAWLIPIYITEYAVVCFLAVWQKAPYRLQACVLVFLLYLLAALELLEGGREGSGRLFLLTFPVVTALLLGRRQGLIALGVSILTMAAFGWAFSTGRIVIPEPENAHSLDPATWLASTGVLLLVSLLLVASQDFLLRRFYAALSREGELAEELEAERLGLEEQVAGRTRVLQATAEVSRATTSVLDPSLLLPQVVELVRDRFGLYYVGLFLVDEERLFATLRAGTGKAGRQMVDRGHKLAVGGSSMIGQCVAKGEARIAQDVGMEVVRFDNPLLPETKSELALPLRSRGRVIGAMTVQSTQSGTFDEAYIAVLQTMADQVAIAIDNAQLFDSAQVALREAETVHRRYVGQAWSEYLRMTEVTGYETERSGASPLGDKALPEIEQAVERQGAVVLELNAGAQGSDGGMPRSALVTPISVRGEVIGALGVHREDSDRTWSDEDIDLVGAISEQFALAAENLRLLEDTLAGEARERLMSEISANIRSAVSVDDAVQRAIRHLGRAVAASQVTAYVGPEAELLAHRERWADE